METKETNNTNNVNDVSETLEISKSTETTNINNQTDIITPDEFLKQLMSGYSKKDKNVTLLYSFTIDYKKLNNDDYIRSVAKTLQTKINQYTLEMAMLVWIVINKKLYKVWGYSNVDEYADKELGMVGRKAYYLSEIFEYYCIKLADYPDVGIKLMKYGWSKMYKLIGIVNNENLDFWLSKLDDMNIRELEELVRGHKLKERSEKFFDKDEVQEISNIPDVIVLDNNTGKTDKLVSNDNNVLVESVQGNKENKELGKLGQFDISLKRFSVDLTDDQYGIVQKAMYLASQKTDFNQSGYLLSLICMSYISEHTENDSALSKVLKKLESMNQIKLIAVKDGSIIYGDDFVDEIILKE